MIGLLIVTHGDLGKALISSSELIQGKKQCLSELGLYHGDNTDELQLKIINEIKELAKKGDENSVLVLVDMLGGSPSNAAACAIHELRNDIHIECVTGVNLPMLLEISTQRDYKSLSELREIALEAGSNSVLCLKSIIGM